MNKDIINEFKNYPVKSANDTLINGCLVLEGGAFRGTYTEGVLDALMENDINLDCVIGVSAGAMNGMNYVSGQIGRAIKVTMNYRHDSRYIGKEAYKTDRGLVGFQFLFGKLMELEFFDREKFNDAGRRFIATVTNCKSGKAEYFEKGKCADIDAAVKASAALPIVSQPVNIDGTDYFDGGCACKIPYQWAIDNGYEKIIVVKTRHNSYRKDLKKNGLNGIMRRKFKQYPNLLESLSHSNENYNFQCDELSRLCDDGRLFVISPSENVSVSRFEGDLKKLKDLYYLGYNDTIMQLDEIKKYLKI